MDHAGALGDSQNIYGGFSGMNRCAGQFGRVSVVMMACAKSAIPCFVVSRAAVSSGSLAYYFIHRQRDADDAGGGWKNLGGAQVQKPGQFAADQPAIPYPGFAGGAIGVAGIYDHVREFCRELAAK
jgi:hypothetical protein